MKVKFVSYIFVISLKVEFADSEEDDYHRAWRRSNHSITLAVLVGIESNPRPRADWQIEPDITARDEAALQPCYLYYSITRLTACFHRSASSAVSQNCQRRGRCFETVAYVVPTANIRRHVSAWGTGIDCPSHQCLDNMTRQTGAMRTCLIMFEIMILFLVECSMNSLDLNASVAQFNRTITSCDNKRLAF
ncbi:unnamed protein product [Nesidiocoris tenuis]|uniref:Uncharacterized protein n=1 Tax=Nesidiocoris tenuis TaxID=355587 RepID=A0A6H5HS57_9HEMI|nr:unnamed protein product [Nesidiocoris tenuis]